MYAGQEKLDNVVWDQNDADCDETLKRMRLEATCRQVEDLAVQWLGRPATLVPPLIIGGFNVLYRIRLEGAPDVLVRLPGPCLVQFPDEKTVQEAATAKYIAKHTKIPIPHHHVVGEDPTLGPFIIMEYVAYRSSLSTRLRVPNDNPGVTHTLNPNLSETTLENLWTQVADSLLQLSRLSFPRIGSLIDLDGGDQVVAGRPITHNMTDMVRLANIPPACLPQEGQTFGTADEWYVSLAEMHLAQLLFQHNDVVSSEDDCRNKYVARQIFRRLAKQGRLSTFGFADDDWSAQSSKATASTLCPAPAGSHSFRLWGDDFRAGNILLNETDGIAAIIDWEYTYAGPTQFILDPPWWLLLSMPETWPSGIDNWRKTYDMRLKTWLSAMKRAEDDSQEPGPLPYALSTYMRESWETGRFWLNYAARKSWAFDAVYWRYLDERFFGERGKDVRKEDLWKTRYHLLSEDEKTEMEPFVSHKMEGSTRRMIVDWDAAEAKDIFSEILFD